MDEWMNLTKTDWVLWIAGLFALLNFGKYAWEIAEYWISKIGLETKEMRKKREQQELLLNAVEKVNMLERKNENIRRDIDNLTKMFIDKQIDDMRFEILDFASAISLGRNYSKEQFDHVIVIDKKYQKILEDNGLENGQVTASMEVIMDVYKEKLRTGF